MRLPGQDLVERGVQDLSAGRSSSKEALLVAIGAPRLRSLGVHLPGDLPQEPERKLYQLLAAEDPLGAHSAFNALVRRLVSYEQALAQSDEKQRAQRRANWPIARYKLGEEPSDDLSAVTTPEERLAMMWSLALDAWRLTGRPFPQYARKDTPGVVHRPKGS